MDVAVNNTSTQMFLVRGRLHSLYSFILAGKSVIRVMKSLR